MDDATLQEYDRNWYGTQTIANTPLIAKRLEHMLTGKRYTFAATNDGFNPNSSIGFEVRTDQRLKDGSKANVWQDRTEDPPRFINFNLSDTYGVWGVSTSNTDSKYDPTFNAPYWVFERNRARVTHRAPAGYLLVWVVAIQSDDKE